MLVFINSTLWDALIIIRQRCLGNSLFFFYFISEAFYLKKLSALQSGNLHAGIY